MTTLVVTGSPGAGVGLAAAALALRLADSHRATLLISLSSPAVVGALLGTPVSGEPRAVAPNLEVLALDPSADLAGYWEAGSGSMPSQLAQLAGDELPLLPGMGALFGFQRLRELTPRYECVVVDAGPHDTLVQLLNLPDIMRWGVRLLFGLDRGPGKSAASQARALLPTSFLPTDMTDRAQQFRVQTEALRDDLLRTAQALYVLRPDGPALAEARLAIPAIQLHGMPVAALLIGPLLPAGGSDAALSELQSRLLDEAGDVWPERPQRRIEAQIAIGGIAGLRAAGGDLDTLAAIQLDSPIAESYNGEPALAVDLPGLPQGALQLTLSGDDLIVRIGPYRRHVLLPERLRGITAIRATREGSRLIVRRRG